MSCTPYYIYISLIFLTACHSNTNSSNQLLSGTFVEIMQKHPVVDIDIQKDTTALAAQTLIQEIWDSTYGQDSSGQVLRGQWQKFTPDPLKAKKALEFLQKSASNTVYAPKSIEYAYILKLTAYAYHFLQEDYSYMKGLPETYKQAQQYIQQALELSKKTPKLQAKWHLEAAILAAPKIYFGFKAPTVTEADLRVEKHLRKAVQYYQSTQNRTEELRIWQLFDWYNQSESFNYYEYYQHLVDLISLENGEHALATALAISKWSKYTIGPYKQDTLDALQISKVLEAAQKALTIFNNNELDKNELAWASNLINDLSYHYKYHKKDKKKAMIYSQQALKFCKTHKLGFASTAQSLAAVFMEQKQWNKALTTYQDALDNSPKLAYIDKEHFHFGIGIIHYYQQGQEIALTYWKNNLSNQKIMNGVSGYTWYFEDNEFKKQLKKDVLKLAKAIDYDHLINIVTKNWQLD